MTGSTLARRSLGRRLRKLRDAAKLSQSAAARAVELSPQSIGRLEDGQVTRVSGLHINALCNLYGVSDDERRLLLELGQEAREASKSGGKWWRAYADLSPDGFEHYYGLEEAARRFTSFQITMVPGLLQTADYRRAGEWTMHPQDSTPDVERRVEMAIRRQERLQDREFEVDLYLSQAVLNHQIGGPSVMERQCYHLMTVGELPNVSVRVIPHSVGSHMGLHVGAFVLLEFDRLPASGSIEPPVVYVEGFTGDLYLERDTEIDPYRHALEHIRRVALSEDESRALMGRIAREYRA
ncbi:helix-turn-helix domain-containing protein [Nocardia miyunensis]|uniref:helix-turn-helix domain-containing protein n=1 Tax=Nocardia miyunensis TaxID=282684 RepID=UPI0008303A60|nr:helix-turn-helix transcriptional regulator [Nocardia miyunensis]